MLVAASPNNTSIALDGVSDEEAICLVWARSNDNRNAANSRLMKEALVTALAGCIRPDGSMECVGGRIVHILGSLVMLDFDPANWNCARLEQIKNDIFAKTSQTITAEAELAAKSPDPALSAVGRSYLGAQSQPLDPAVAAKFTEDLRAAVGRMVDGEIAKLGTIITPQHAAGIKTEALAAVI
jgi:hypothetical protein